MMTNLQKLCIKDLLNDITVEEKKELIKNESKQLIDCYEAFEITGEMSFFKAIIKIEEELIVLGWTYRQLENFKTIYGYGER